MSDEKKYAFDAKLAKQTVTRAELWRAMAVIRSTIANLHIYHLAARVGDEAEKVEANAELKESMAAMRDYMDDLLGMTEVSNDGS